MRYVRIFADSEGESHFEDVDIPMTPVEMIPPAPPLNLAGFEPANQVSFLSGPPGWYGEPHRAPKPSIYFCLQGEWEIETSDGERRRFGPGAVLRTDDTTGKGHITRVIGEQAALAGVVQLAS